MRRLLLSALLAAIPFTAVAQMAGHDHGGLLGTSLQSSNTRGQAVTIPSGTETTQAEIFLGMGKQRATGPAIILVHEWWGLNDWVRDQAREFAAMGYTVLAVDLYRGSVADNAETAHELMRGLPHDRALRDMEGAFTYLRAVAGANTRIGVVGWCMGGGYAIDFAVTEPRLGAVVVNYGALPTDKDTLARIQAPVLGNFGGMDKGITPAMVTDFETAMRSLHKGVDVKEYPDTGHAFENETNVGGYNAADATDAKRRTSIFLNTQLKR